MTEVELDGDATVYEAGGLLGLVQEQLRPVVWSSAVGVVAK